MKNLLFLINALIIVGCITTPKNNAKSVNEDTNSVVTFKNTDSIVSVVSKDDSLSTSKTNKDVKQITKQKNTQTKVTKDTIMPHIHATIKGWDKIRDSLNKSKTPAKK